MENVNFHVCSVCIYLKSLVSSAVGLPVCFDFFFDNAYIRGRPIFLRVKCPVFFLFFLQFTVVMQYKCAFEIPF
jgi:hypothetical protein